MNKHNTQRFARQLTFYLLCVIGVTFTLIFAVLTNSLQQFIANNAYNQAETITGSLLITFQKQIDRLEVIPSTVNELAGEINDQNVYTFPTKLLKSFPSLYGCTIYYFPGTPGKHNVVHLASMRTKGNMIVPAPLNHDISKFFLPTGNKTLWTTKSGGYWIHSIVGSTPTLALCSPIYNASGRKCGILMLDFPTVMITDFLTDNKPFKTGYFFITDNAGNLIYYPQKEKRNMCRLTDLKLRSETKDVYAHILSGGTGFGKAFDGNNKENYLYYTHLPRTDWQVGMICPYNQILLSTNRLYMLLIICLSIGVLFLFMSISKIVRHLSFPLRRLAESARSMADGDFDVEMPEQNQNLEIKELYASFRYLRDNLVKYIGKLTQATAEKERINVELRLAHRIQQRFLPSGISLPPNISLYGTLSQSNNVGGDLYEHFISGNLLYFAIGDVSGKGIPAALYMSSFIKLFRYVAQGRKSSAEICDTINNQMCADSEDDMYITLFMGILDINTGIITYTNAGHPDPLIVHKNGEISFLNKFPDLPIGLIEDHHYTEHITTLRPGQMMILYTDGITDTEDCNSVFFGKEKLLKCVKDAPVREPEQICEYILSRISHHMEGRGQSDDLTLMSIQYKGLPGQIQDWII